MSRWTALIFAVLLALALHASGARGQDPEPTPAPPPAHEHDPHAHHRRPAEPAEPPTATESETESSHNEDDHHHHHHSTEGEEALPSDTEGAGEPNDPAEPRDHRDHQDHQGHRARQDHQDHQEHQDHQDPDPRPTGHQHHAPPPSSEAEEHGEDRHRGHDEHAAPAEPPASSPSPAAHQHHRHDADGEPAAEQAPPVHDHSRMEHDVAAGEESVRRPGPSPLVIPKTPATAPVRPYFDTPEMDRARAEARREMGGGRFLLVQADRFEWRSNEGEPVGLFEGQGWYGGDHHRLWVKADAEALLDAPSGADEIEEAEIQALYSRPISPYFDLQAGVRQDLEPGSRTHAVIGVQGLAPQWFELDLSLFVSEDGDLSSRLEAEYDMLLTQRLALQVRAEVELSGSEVPELGIGSGLTTAEAGVRLSYGRRFAPYVGVEWEKAFGGTADFARAEGEETGAVSAVVGFRFWR